jgi:hypothetical protein
MRKDKLIYLLQVILGVTFVFSAISKLIAPGLFELTIIEQGIIASREIASYLSRVLIIFELFLGLALLQPYYLKKLVLPLSLLTLIGFTVFLAFSVFAGDSNNCGCFGEVLKMSPLQAIIKNIVLIAVGFFIYNSTKQNSTKLYIPSLLLLFSIGIVFITAPIKSYEDLVFSKYINFENEGRVDLTDGEKLVAIFFIDCEHCLATAKEIVEFEKTNSKLENLYILFAGEESDSIKQFLNDTNIEHPYLRISIDDFFDLIGNAPPRVYWLQNGSVKEIWDDNFIENILRIK